MNYLGRGEEASTTIQVIRGSEYHEIRKVIASPSAAKGACPVGLLIVWGGNLKASQEIASSLRSSQ